MRGWCALARFYTARPAGKNRDAPMRPRMLTLLREVVAGIEREEREEREELVDLGVRVSGCAVERLAHAAAKSARAMGTRVVRARLSIGHTCGEAALTAERTAYSGASGRVRGDTWAARGGERRALLAVDQPVAVRVPVTEEVDHTPH